MFKNFNPSYLSVSGHQSEVIELALTYGFSGMDLSITDFATRVRLKGLPYARRLIDSARIRIGTFVLPLDLDAADDVFAKDVKKLSEYADAAASIGCTRCTTIVPPAGDKRPLHENFEFYRRRLQEVAAAFQPAGIRLALGFQGLESLRKNHAFQFIHDLEALLQLVGMIGSPSVGVLLDVWDVFAGGGNLDSIHLLTKEQVVAVQIAEMSASVAPADLEEKHRLLPDAEGGKIGVASILSHLSKIGYDGPVTVKPSRTVFPNRRRDTIVKLTSESLERVWNAAGLPTPPRQFVASAPAPDLEM